MISATQLRDTVMRLIRAGHRRPGDPDILIVMDSGREAFFAEGVTGHDAFWR